MKKQYTVPASFILQGHKSACAAWKSKLESEFPLIFAPKEYKYGTIVNLYGDDYIISSIAESVACLVNIKTGNRWSDSVRVKGVFSVSQEELELLIQSEDIYNAANYSIGGAPITKYLDTSSMVTVDESFLRAAFGAADKEWKDRIRKAIPEAFPKYVKLINTPNDHIELGTEMVDSADRRVWFTIGNGLAPSTDLEKSCIMFESKDPNVSLELETGVDDRGVVWVAVKEIYKK